MVSKDNKYKSDYLGAVPTAERSYFSQISVSADGSLIAYCVENVVIVRRQDNDLKDGIVIFQGHKCKTTAVDIAPNGVFAASADIEGNVKIWFLDDGFSKFNHQVLESKILGIHWNEKSDRLLVYGYGGKKGFARYVSWDTSNNMGDIIGMSKNCIAGDIKRSKPYYYIVSSEDLTLRVYGGNNPTVKYVNKEHNKYIFNAKFSPSGLKFAVGGLDRRLVIYETESGKPILEVPKEHEIQHNGGILGISWLTEDILATCGTDKAIKIWDLIKVENSTLYPTTPDKIESEEFCQCSIVKAKNYLITLNLNGTLNMWSLAGFNAGNGITSFSTYPDKIIYGHQAGISKLLFNYSENKLYSFDVLGKVVVWDKKKDTSQISIFTNDVVGVSFNQDETILNGLTVEGKIISYDLKNKEVLHSLVIKEEAVGMVTRSDGAIISLFRSKLCIVENGQLTKEINLKYKSQCIEYNYVTNEIYVGDSLVSL